MKSFVLDLKSRDIETSEIDYDEQEDVRARKSQIGQAIRHHGGWLIPGSRYANSTKVESPVMSMNKFQINFRTISALYEARRKPSAISEALTKRRPFISPRARSRTP